MRFARKSDAAAVCAKLKASPNSEQFTCTKREHRAQLTHSPFFLMEVRCKRISVRKVFGKLPVRSLRHQEMRFLTAIHLQECQLFRTSKGLSSPGRFNCYAPLPGTEASTSQNDL
jgi:hypothetical protein